MIAMLMAVNEHRFDNINGEIIPLRDTEVPPNFNFFALPWLSTPPAETIIASWYDLLRLGRTGEGEENKLTLQGHQVTALPLQVYHAMALLESIN